MKPARTMNHSRRTGLVLAGVLAAFPVSNCLAEPGGAPANRGIEAVPAAVATSVIDGNALQNTRGVMAVNQAAGDANLQVNSAAVAIGDQAALAQVHSLQMTGRHQANAPDVAISAIEGGAFRNARGALSINQASGVGNAQANGIAIAVSGGVVIAESLSESMLAESVAGTPAAAETTPHVRSATIADTAFVGARGLVQVNQTAGSGNATANNFALSVTLGAQP